jgi:hypothetical protein
VAQQLSQADFVPRINNNSPTSTEARCSVDITVAYRNSRWTKDDLLAGAELGIVVAIGAIAGWFTGIGIVVGAAASLASFWIALTAGCLLESFRSK